MGSEQSSVTGKSQPRAPPVRRGHTIAVGGTSDGRVDATASGSNSPGASVCSDSELPYISYTVDRPIGDSPKATARSRAHSDRRVLPRRPALPPRRPPAVVVVKLPRGDHMDEDICRLQDIPTFLPIMRAPLGLPGARDPEVLEGLDYRPWVRLTSRLQAHLSACAQPIAAEEASLSQKIKEADVEISRLYAAMCDRQRSNARHAERLSRAHELGRQLGRATAVLNQTLQDAEELNNLLPEDKRLEPFVWNENKEATVKLVS